MSKFNDKSKKITAKKSIEQSTDGSSTEAIIKEMADVTIEASPTVTVDKIQEPTSTQKDTGSADNNKKSAKTKKSGGSHISDNSSSSVTATKIAGYSTGAVNAYSVFDASPNANNYVAQRYSTVNSFRRYNSDEYNINFKNWGQLGKLVEGKDVYQLNTDRPNVIYNNDNFKNDFINNRVYTNYRYNTLLPRYITHTAPGVMFYNNFLNISGIINRATTASTAQNDLNQHTINRRYNTTGILTLAPLDTTDSSGVSEPIMNYTAFDINANSLEYYCQNGYQTSNENSRRLDRTVLPLNYDQSIPRDYYVSYSNMNRRLWFDIAWNTLSNYNINEQSVLPLNAIQNIEHYSIVMNSISRLKTFLYIVKDAINGAISSQTILAAKVGTIESTFATFAYMPAAVLTQYENAINAMDKALVGIPVLKDVIESWNRVKSWTKSKDGNLFTVDNTLQIPTFILGFDQLFDYSNTNQTRLTPTSGTNISPLSSPLINRDRRLMTPFRLNISSNYVNIPHGDWLSMFISGVLTNQRIEDFFRINFPASTDFNNQTNNTQTASGRLTDGIWQTTGTNQKVLRDIVNDYYRVTGSSQTELFTSIPSIELADGVYNARPDNTATDFVRSNGSAAPFRGDFVISNHTFTAWMQMFIYKVAQSQEWISTFINNINAVKPFFNLLNQVVPIKDYYSLDYELPTVKFGLIKGTEPNYDKLRNRLIVSSWFRRRWSTAANLYIEANNVNNFTIQTDANPGLTNRNALTISTASTYLDQQGNALSNVHNNRVRAIAYTATAPNNYLNAVILMNSDILFKDWTTHLRYIGSHAFLSYGTRALAQAQMINGIEAPEVQSYTFLDSPAISRVGNVIRNRFLTVNGCSDDALYSSSIFGAFDQPFEVVYSDTEDFVSRTYDVPVVAFTSYNNDNLREVFSRMASLVSIRVSTSTAERDNKMLADSTYKPDKNSGTYISEADLISI